MMNVTLSIFTLSYESLIPLYYLELFLALVLRERCEVARKFIVPDSAHHLLAQVKEITMNPRASMHVAGRVIFCARISV